jgi:calcineurin-like phosphoesterase family protein
MKKFSDERKVWITSDTHYNHKNICRGVTEWRLPDGSIPIDQTRDFPNLFKMNDAIVNNINQYVGQDDILIHGGDWSFGGFENIEEFRNRIICREIHLVLGNHDHHIEKNRGNCQSLFTSVQDFLRFEYMGHTIEFFHYPITSWNGLKKGRIHLHGHCHLNHMNKVSNGRRMDIGIDGNLEFRPYDLLYEVMNSLLKRPIGSELGNLDHHTDMMKNIVG